MVLDIRIPIGIVFTVTGLLIFVYGLIYRTPAPAGGSINVDAVWGAVLISFGSCMLLVSRRHR